MTEKVSRQEGKAPGPHCIPVSKQMDVKAGPQLVFSLFSLRHQPTACWPRHSMLGFPPKSDLSRNTLNNRPRDVSVMILHLVQLTTKIYYNREILEISSDVLFPKQIKFVTLANFSGINVFISVKWLNTKEKEIEILDSQELALASMPPVSPERGLNTCTMECQQGDP